MTNIQTLRESTFPLPFLASCPCYHQSLHAVPLARQWAAQDIRVSVQCFFSATSCSLLFSSALPSFSLFFCALMWVLHRPQSAHRVPALARVLQGLQCLWGTVVQSARADCDWHWAAPDHLPQTSPLQHCLPPPLHYQNLAKGTQYNLLSQLSRTAETQVIEWQEYHHTLCLCTSLQVCHWVS